MTVTGDHLARWLARLVQLPSVTPDMAGPRAGVSGEGAIAEAVAGWFRDFGGDVHVDPVQDGRPNVYGIWRGSSQQWMAVDCHTDTVGVEQMVEDPFSGRIQDGRVYGRGAVDTKASLAIMLALLESMHHTGQKPAHNLLVAATIDEETGTTGAPAAARWIRDQGLVIDELLVAEPTLCRPIYGHKGVVRLEFGVEGSPAHSSQPDQGRNAITAAAHLVIALEQEHRRIIALERSTELGAPTLTVTLIDGGAGINVVPEMCRLSLDRRVVAGEDPVAVTAELQELARSACPLPLDLRILCQIGAFYQAPDAPWLQELRTWSGQEPTVAPYGTNAWAYADVARQRAVLGPGSVDQAHGAQEWVAIAELEKAAQIYRRWWGIDLGT